jgi:hypothetical protein
MLVSEHHRGFGHVGGIREPRLRVYWTRMCFQPAAGCQPAPQAELTQYGVFRHNVTKLKWCILSLEPGQRKD